MKYTLLAIVMLLPISVDAKMAFYPHERNCGFTPCWHWVRLRDGRPGYCDPRFPLRMGDNSHARNSRYRPESGSSNNPHRQERAHD